MENQKYYVIGSTHIDLAWTKDEEEFAEMLEVFVVRLLDALETNPKLTYVLEQAYHFRSLKERRTDLVQRLKKFIQEGRLEFVGGMASSMETNIPNGECLIRNQMLGMKWVREHLGADVRTGWLIDTFGLNAQIPQILNQFGIRHLLANRLGGTKYHDVFIDKGLDGSEVLIAGRDAYSPFIKPGHVLFSFVQSREGIDRLFNDAGAHKGPGPILVMPYTENEGLLSLRFVQRVEKERNEGRGADWGYAVPADFFKALEETGEAWPIEHGDLNPEFTATFSQRMPIRTRNRKVENLLLEAEKWAVLAGRRGFEDSLEKAWWLMAFNHFHDVFTGSHPTKVYQDVMGYFDQVEDTASRLLEETALAAVDRTAEGRQGCESIKVFNGLPFERKDIIELALEPEGAGCDKVTCRGLEMPFEVVDGRLRIMADLPAASIHTISITKGGKGLIQKTSVNHASIENEYISLECDHQTGLKRLVWKPTGQVLVENADDFLVIQRDDGSFQIESPSSAEVPAGAGTLWVNQYETSPVCSRISLGGTLPHVYWAGPDSHLEWEAEFSLIPGKPVLYLKLKVNWKGEGSRIRLKLPTLLTASEGIYEIPFGVVKRRPYGTRGTARGEWPAQRFAAVEGAEYGLALVNTGVPGVEINGGTLWTTILRAPKSEQWGMTADETSSQHGRHQFDFALIPYQGGWEESGVVRLAQEMNSPLLSVPFSGTDIEQGGTSLLCLEPANLVLSAVKAPEDGADEVILRFYETAGKEVQGRLWLAGAEAAWASDLRETKGEALECRDSQVQVTVKPFEIKTLRLKRNL